MIVDCLLLFIHKMIGHLIKLSISMRVVGTKFTLLLFITEY